MSDTEPAQPADDVAALRHQRDLLGGTLGRVLVKLGMVNDVPLTGPQLLCAAEDWLALNDGLDAGKLEP
jgi:hypothetical protein